MSSKILNNPRRVGTLLKSGKPSGEVASYDYIIVGGGTAGCVLASRLSEDPDVTLLLVEAGKSHYGDLLTKIPFAWAKKFGTQSDWSFRTVAQSSMTGRDSEWPRGRILGGSSSINALIYHRCAPEDFDAWVKLGARGWGSQDLQPYFEKAEKYYPSALYPGINKDEHGKTGPIKTGHPAHAPIIDSFVQAAQELGIAKNEDLNTSRGTLGVTHFVATVDERGERSSTATAYLTQEVLSRKNLSVLVETMAERIIFDSGGKKPRAKGIQISVGRGSVKYQVNCKKEVILCAGAVSSPQLLLVSGVGPIEELAALKIPLVKELPMVGKKLSDHISCGPLQLRAKVGNTWDHVNTIYGGAVALSKWLWSRSGPLSTLAMPAGIFVRSTDESLPFQSKLHPGENVRDLSSGPGAPDIEILWVPALSIDYGRTPTPAGMAGCSASAIVLRPESVGSITLKTDSIYDYPIIDPNYFASRNDMNVCIRGTRLLLRLARAKTLSPLLDLKENSDDESTMFFPGDADPDKVTDEQLERYIRKNASAVWHPTSTASMGSSESDSVVDTSLRVHGVEGLRVVDASIFPTQVSGHPCAVVVAIAEKAADLVCMREN